MPQRGPGVTIKHVAADAGVSLQTVSRVINKAPNVRPETTARVQASIDKLGYVPLIAAQRMGGAGSRLILALNDRDRTIADWRSRQGADWVDQMLLGGRSVAHQLRRHADDPVRSAEPDCDRSADRGRDLARRGTDHRRTE
ncbi:hypothetical protein FHT01_002158 [Sphingomonas japonica]|uniref:HTH lacI-type domain-containing protein n=1 Tax=Sphingomonas japonica TaxID=511662 RepID=A0ABX0U222_9SPHN|nr:hypothetical protein [Sphingomonas japonica]